MSIRSCLTLADGKRALRRSTSIATTCFCALKSSTIPGWTSCDSSLFDSPRRN